MFINLVFFSTESNAYLLFMLVLVLLLTPTLTTTKSKRNNQNHIKTIPENLIKKRNLNLLLGLGKKILLEMLMTLLQRNLYLFA
jgi:hypothetical protein